MISLRRLDPATIASLLATARESSLTYADVGASRNEQLPSGYHHVRRSERIGGAADFERACHGLRTWAVQEGAGLRVYPTDPLEPDATILAVTSIGPVQIVVPCRVVTVFKEPDTFGFAYGTLAGHPERGEESFVLERRDGATFFTVRAFSNPVDPLARLAGPLGRVVQRSITRRYVNALRRYVESDATNQSPNS
ncbi:MAG: DUF1990 domain-containing protein [Acidimicrobiales bacterium]